MTSIRPATAPRLLVVLATVGLAACPAKSVRPSRGVTVQVAPASAAVVPGRSVGFIASVTGTLDTSVTWSVAEAEGGTIDQMGLYTAPAAEGSFHVVATSAADPTKSGTASVAVSSFADLIPPDRITRWNPGIQTDGQLGLPLGADRLPVRTTVCRTVDATTYGNGASDATAGIQAAINACPAGQVVQLSAGDFKVTGTLLITKGIVLRGQGPSQTRLKMPVGTTSDSGLILVGTIWFKFTQSVNLASDAVKWANSVTLASNPGLVAGEIVLVDQVTNPAITEWSTKSPPGDASRTWFTRTDRPVGQVMEVASFSGNTVTFTTPFHIDFQTAYAAQLTRFAKVSGGSPAPSVKYAGVEDLYVYGGSNGQGNITLSNAAYSWVKNVESDYQNGPAIAIDACFRCVVRDSYVHSTQDPNPGGGGYGFSFSWYSADNLLENNISWNMNKVMVMRASGGGNVVGYNYFEDGWIQYNPGWMEVGANGSHMTCPHFELFEGNQAFNFDGDNTWGNSVYITAFRNHFTGTRRSIPPLSLVDKDNRRTIGLMEGHWWYNFVGNVQGYPGIPSAVSMWSLGYNPENWDAPPDPKVLSTILRDGNYDFVTDQVHWAGGIEKPLPNSLYLTIPPAFFAGSTWPWVDPAGATKLYTLPARARFDALHP